VTYTEKTGEQMKGGGLRQPGAWGEVGGRQL
jgi:hypothetical protein